MSRITGYQRAHFDVGVPSSLSRLGYGLFKVACLVSTLAIIYFALKALMESTSERKPNVLEIKADLPQLQNHSALSTQEWINYLVQLARDDLNSFEEAYLRLITEEKERFGKLIDSMKKNLFDRLRAEGLFETVHRNMQPSGILYEDLFKHKELYPPAPAPSAPPRSSLPPLYPNQNSF